MPLELTGQPFCSILIDAICKPSIVALMQNAIAYCLSIYLTLSVVGTLVVVAFFKGSKDD
jgi:hypothetical protein